MLRKTPLAHGKPLVRRARLVSRVRVRPRNAKRWKANLARAYGPEARREWMKGLPCLTCGRGPSENAHVATGGMGRKADASQLAPLCHSCHLELHAHGAVVQKWGKDVGMVISKAALAIAAEACELAWRARCGESVQREAPTEKA